MFLTIRRVSHLKMWGSAKDGFSIATYLKAFGDAAYEPFKGWLRKAWK